MTTFGSKPPEEKAQEFIDAFKEFCFHNFDNDAEQQILDNAKGYALVAIYYLMTQLNSLETTMNAEANYRMNYLEQVKQVLEKIKPHDWKS